jgi:3-deoxy-manno-octulosonate cytidylyltransferase (CMP-KDO synthetase)
MSFHVIIPARYASSRLPAKPLADIHGQPMIAWTLQQAKKSGAQAVYVATDDARVHAVLPEGQVLMTGAHHESGTERLAEVCDLLSLPDEAVVVNVQGDEPMIPPAIIRQVAENLLACPPEVGMASLCEPIETVEALLNPNVVKVVMDAQGYALYFSRAPIAYPRDAFAKDKSQLPCGDWYRHIGIYAYRAGFIREYLQMMPCALEKVEALEQLRVLYHGRKIHMAVAAQASGVGVDTPADLERVRDLLSPQDFDVVE